METINDRFLFIANTHFGGNISKMAREFDIRQSTLKDITSGRKNAPAYETIIKVLSSRNFKFNSDWLLLGINEQDCSKREISELDADDRDERIRELKYTIELQKKLIMVLKDV